VFLLPSLLILALLAGMETEGTSAASVSVHPFGRYEMLLQEGVPIETTELVGMVRRKTGIPDYPLMLHLRGTDLELNVLGPGSRPLRLASAQGLASATTRKGAQRFVIERSRVRGAMLVVSVRPAGLSQRVTLRIDLPSLERTLEGAR
jgi:hypothetical protein